MFRHLRDPAAVQVHNYVALDGALGAVLTSVVNGPLEDSFADGGGLVVHLDHVGGSNGVLIRNFNFASHRLGESDGLVFDLELALAFLGGLSSSGALFHIRHGNRVRSGSILQSNRMAGSIRSQMLGVEGLVSFALFEVAAIGQSKQFSVELAAGHRDFHSRLARQVAYGIEAPAGIDFSHLGLRGGVRLGDFVEIKNTSIAIYIPYVSLQRMRSPGTAACRHTD